MKYFRNITKAGLNSSQYMVAAYESINNNFCSVAAITWEFFLKGVSCRVYSLYSKEEMPVFVEEVEARKEVIFSPLSNFVTLRATEQAWLDVTSAVNALSPWERPI